ncbi:response regulator [Saccharibacillus alkalitolerans]|uniref:Response regulator n=1 Tax=Saccharibacillus alkalitolerans TaxID=2705290 RepID=A0ABX0F8L4_9BACL|nr:response regulator [Saccharibacillus alkalitolerans]NGZ76314.1 response regulator [Saccharibacillus alkalitolerans]
MRAMLIDDEKPALIHLERLLRSDGRVDPALLCTSAGEGIELLRTERIDAVFLDIGMPEMNGLEAAEYIQQNHPGVAIIFVTAYSDYAVEAFDLQAIDYLLKPVGAARLGQAIGRIVSAPKAPEGREYAPPSSAGSRTPEICTLRRLELYGAAAGAVHPVKWRTAKAQELFAYLLHRGEQWVPRGGLTDLLWPDMPEDKAVTHLHTSVYQTRKILKEWKPEMRLEYRQESYRLLRGGAETDAERFGREGERLIGAVKGREEQVRQLLSLYRGGYLEQHDYPWAESRAEQLKRLRLKLTLELAEEERHSARPGGAIFLLAALQEEEPFEEEVCRQLMLAHERAGDRKSACRCYEMFARRLDDELGTEPDLRTRQLYERLNGQADGRAARA